MWLGLGSSIVGLFHIWVFPRIKIDHFFLSKKRISVDIYVHFVGNLGYNALNICCFSNSFICHGCTCRLSVSKCFDMLLFFWWPKCDQDFKFIFTRVNMTFLVPLVNMISMYSENLHQFLGHTWYLILGNADEFYIDHI